MSTATAVRSATLPVDALAEALGRVSHVGRKGGSLPIMGHTLVEPVDGDPAGLRLTTTDLDQWVRTTVPCEEGIGEALCVPSDILGGLVKSFAKGEARIEIDGGRMLLHAGGEYAIDGLASDEFPPFPEVEGGTAWTMDAEELRAAMEFCAWPRSKVDGQPILGGTLFDMRAGRVVGCNRHVLAIRPVSDPDEDAPIANVPGDGLRGILGRGDVALRADGRRLTAETDGVEYSVRLIEGHYPDYARLIPTDHKFTATVDRGDLLAAVGRASVYVRRNVAPRVVLTWTDGALTVSCQSADKGAQEEPVATDAEGGFGIGFDVGYLLPALRNLDSGSVLIRATDSERAALWSTPDDLDHFYLIMPMRDLSK